MNKSILERLEQEHQEIMHDLEHIRKSQDHEKHRRFSEVRKKLVDHMNGEDVSVYHHLPEDSQSSDINRLVHISETNHHRIKDILQRLSLIDVHNQNWEGWFNELIELVKDHCIEMGDGICSEAKEAIPHEELARFACEFEEGKHL